VVTQHHDRLVLTMLGQVLFESGEADLTPLGLKIMKQVGQVLATVPGKNIQVEGHTDNHRIYGQLQKQYPTNWELSTARATTVLRYLIEQTGMDPKQFSATGYAAMRPVMTNETEEGRAQNRRVEIVVEQGDIERDAKAPTTKSINISNSANPRYAPLKAQPQKTKDFNAVSIRALSPPEKNIKIIPIRP